jgi:DNA excision repair protein ERCC-3
VIGQFLDQLDALGRELRAPVLTGKTPQKQREQLFNDFRHGRVPVLVVSKVANFSIDLPDASVCIQVSGTFGSRQEEAQRLGRILRPKERHAYFYSIVTRDTCELDFAMNRQLFLTEQGYRYTIEDWRGVDATRLPMPYRHRDTGAEVIDLSLERRRRESSRG